MSFSMVGRGVYLLKMLVLNQHTKKRKTLRLGIRNNALAEGLINKFPKDEIISLCCLYGTL